MKKQNLELATTSEEFSSALGLEVGARMIGTSRDTSRTPSPDTSKIDDAEVATSSYPRVTSNSCALTEASPSVDRVMDWGASPGEKKRHAMDEEDHKREACGIHEHVSPHHRQR